MKLNIKKCKIGGTYYDIKYCDDLRDEKNLQLDGRAMESKTLIKVDTKRQNYQGQLRTLIHEIVHCLIWEYNLMKIKKDEDLSVMLTTAFLAFIIDNPKIIHKILDFYQTKRK